MSNRAKRTVRTKKTDKYAKQKLAAIPLLLGVLGYVLVANFQSQDVGTQTIAATDTPTPLPVRDTTPRQVAPAATSTNKIARWKDTNLDFLKGPPPMKPYLEVNVPQGQLTTASIPSVGLGDQLADVQQQFEEQTTQYVFESGRHRYAVLGSRVLAEGEQITEGVQLQKIQAGTLTIKAAPSVN